MPQTDRTADRIIAQLAAMAYGVVTRRALLDAGITPEEVRHRLLAGALLRVHPGVYRVGHVAAWVEAEYLAAVLACGAGAALGGLAAVHHYRVVREPPSQPEVTCPRERRIPGVAVLRARGLGTRDVTSWREIPAVTVPRALVEVAGRMGISELARACHEAGVRYRTTPRQVDAALSRWPNARGARGLRAVMAGDAKVSLSRLEAAFLALLREHGMPLPVTNRPVGGRRVDCRWQEHQLTVELDSYAFHNSRHSWELDHHREREAYARGDRFRRYTWADVVEDPAAMLAELRNLLRISPAAVVSPW